MPSNIRNGSTSSSRWLPPRAGELKCNIDATLFQEQCNFEISLCLLKIVVVWCRPGPRV